MPELQSWNLHYLGTECEVSPSVDRPRRLHVLRGPWETMRVPPHTHAHTSCGRGGWGMEARCKRWTVLIVDGRSQGQCGPGPRWLILLEVKGQTETHSLRASSKWLRSVVQQGVENGGDWWSLLRFTQSGFNEASEELLALQPHSRSTREKKKDFTKLI